MPEHRLKALYMAKSLNELNANVKIIPQATANRLIKSAHSLFKNAESLDSVGDEERSYVYFMRYFAVAKSLQSLSDYKADKKHYDQLLGTDTMKKAIDRAEKLSTSLNQRYERYYPSLLSPEEKEPQEKTESLKKANSNKKSSYITSPICNGVAEPDGFILCEELYSLINQKSSSFLVVDVRPRKEFEESSMKLSNLINIPAENLKPGLTAESAGRELDENYRLLWGRRHTYDYLIICDFTTEKLPLPPPITIIKDAMLKWDPGKQYRSTPSVLKSGYDMFRLMYPMHTFNPRVNLTASNISSNTSSPPTSVKNGNLSLNFDYPDLDTAFISTPSPDRTGETFKYDLRSSLLPKVNRYLKPSPTSNISTSSQAKQDLDSTIDDFEPAQTYSKVNNIINKSFGNGRSPAKEITSEANNKITLEKQPNIPNRTLKPKELLESLNAKSPLMEREQEILELSIAAEQETLSKLQEIEQTQKEEDGTQDEKVKIILAETKARLNEDIKELKMHRQKIDADYAKIQKENKELWKIVRQFLATQNNQNSNVDSSIQPSVHLDSTTQKEGKKIRVHEEKRQALLREVEDMRKKRKEKERLVEQERAERRNNEKVKTAEEELRNANRNERNEIEEDRSSPVGQPKWAEKSSRSHDMQDGSHVVTRSRAKGDSHHTRLKSSPETSPVRGGTNLRRSHSALNLSQLRNDEPLDSPGGLPAFDRNLKPFESPKRRNVNAARQRNFEPKYGNVGPARTGLKNLGNTCYMNSIIQCLNNTLPLVKYFYNGHYSEDINENSTQKGDIAEEIGAVVRAMWCGQYKSIAMWDLKAVIGKHHKPFLGYDQHDSHEFLIKLIDWLHDDLNLVQVKPGPMKEQDFDNVPDYVAAQKIMSELNLRDDSIVRSILHGLHRSLIICTTCEHRSLTFEPFSVLTFSFFTSGRCSLKDMINDYYKESRIEYTCSRCKKPRNCIRKMDIWKLPPILIIHLNRFEHDVLMKKNQNYVDFPLENLDLTNYVSANSNRHTSFDLYGASNHYGTMDGGHYTAYCRTQNRNWLKFDDNEVYDLPRESVRSSAAYILFYEAANLNVKVI